MLDKVSCASLNFHIGNNLTCENVEGSFINNILNNRLQECIQVFAYYGDCSVKTAQLYIDD